MIALTREEEYERLYLELAHLQQNGERKGASGICAMVADSAMPFPVFGLWCRAKARLFDAWPGSSGNPVYPVPGDERSAAETFESAVESGTLWEDEYGARREDLFAFLVDECKRRAGL